MKAIRFFRSLLWVLGVGVHAPAFAVDITGTWDLRGTLQIDANVKNEKVSTKAAFNNSTLVFGAKNNFLIDGNYQLSGTWSRKKLAFQGVLNSVSVKTFLANMATDLSAKSGLIVKPVVSAFSLTGTELTNGTLNGEWLIISKITFPAYPKDVGVLRINYRFSGQRAK